MQQIHVREANSEVLVFIDKNMGSRLNALREAARILQVEVVREESRLNRDINRPT